MVKGRRRRGAISAEVYTEEDAASYVRKVPARGNVSDECELFPLVNTDRVGRTPPFDVPGYWGAGFCNNRPLEEVSIVIIKQ